MSLPEGYRVERDPDVWVLIGPGGEIVARFGPGVNPAEVERAAWDHERGEGFRELAVAALVGIVAGVMLAWCYGLPGAL